MSRSPRLRRADASGDGTTAAAPSLAVVVLATLAVLVTAADTYVVVLALPDILTGIGVGLDELQRATPIIGGFLLGYTATLPLLGRLADLRGRVPVLVADRWPPERRSVPLGVVGAVQEAGAVLGPLAGAAVLAVADWRAIFWLNLLLALLLAGGVLVSRGVAGGGRRPDGLG